MKYAWFTLALLLSSLLVWGGCGLTKHIILAVDAYKVSAPGPTSGLVSKSAEVLDHLTQSCGGGHPCGTLSNIDKVLVKTGDAVVQTQLMEQAAVPHTVAAMDTLNSSAAKIGTTADSASAVLNEGTETLRQINDPGHGVGATLANVNTQIDDLNGYLKSSVVQNTVTDLSTSAHHLAGISDSADKMLSDAQWKEHQLLHPDKTKLTFVTGLEAGLLWTHKYVLPQINLF